MTENTERAGGFDVPHEARGWHTALYYFAEHMRSLSHGKVNHKVLYSYIGTNGHYINHDNPTIRKRTAAVLSRLVHSRRYVDDFRQSYESDPGVFDKGAVLLCAALCDKSGCNPAGVLDHFRTDLWRDIERGLRNEKADGRTELNLDRATNEMRLMLGWSETQPAAASREVLVVLMSSYFHLMTFGCVNERLVRILVDATPVENPASPQGASTQFGEHRACLIRYDEEAAGAVGSWWIAEPGQPLAIGRYSDSDIIESNPFVSRLHCRITYRDGAWLLTDEGSTHGTRVVRNDSVVFDSKKDGCGPFPLAEDDRIVLAQTSRYWFGAFVGEDRPTRG